MNKRGRESGERQVRARVEDAAFIKIDLSLTPDGNAISHQMRCMIYKRTSLKIFIETMGLRGIYIIFLAFKS